MMYVYFLYNSVNQYWDKYIKVNAQGGQAYQQLKSCILLYHSAQ